MTFTPFPKVITFSAQKTELRPQTLRYLVRFNMEAQRLDHTGRSVLRIGAGKDIDGFLLSSIHSQLLNNDSGDKHLPSALLSDEPGQKLWSAVTHTPEYYLTSAEIRLFELFGHDICSLVPDNAVMIDLGCG